MGWDQLTKLNRAGGKLARSVEFGILAAFAMGAWGTGAEMFFWLPLLAIGLVLALVCITTTEWSRRQKSYVSILLALFFVGEGTLLYWHSHATSPSSNSPLRKIGEGYLSHPLTMRDLLDTDFTAEANGFGPVMRAQAFAAHDTFRDTRTGKT